MLTRQDDSFLTNWFYQIDRKLLWSVFGLTAIGFILMITTGSAAASRIGQPWHFFLLKMIPFYFIGIITIIFASMMDKKWVIGISIANAVICLGLLLITLVAPYEVKGSARFVMLPIIGSVMPSDILKPGFIILTAFFLAKMRETYGANFFMNKEAWRAKLISWWPYLGLFLIILGIIAMHPDMGTTILYLGTLLAMLFIAGMPWMPIIIIMASGAVLFTIAVLTVPRFAHVYSRIMNFFTGTGDNYQTRQSVDSIKHGGLFGAGNNSFVKESLPDSHTDYIYSALAEDYGGVAAVLFLGLMLYILKRLVSDAMNSRDAFVFYATGGTAALFGIQISINLLTALNMIPPKGMTLPFISYGGSSFVSFSLLFGLIIALIRLDKWNK